MKKNNIIKCALFVTVLAFSFIMMSACVKDEAVSENLWENALYTEDKTFGEGEKTIELEVKAEEKSVTFTINTDENNLEDALCEHKLIEGEEGPYGLYVKKVNGMVADYDVDQSFWSLCKGDTPLMTGVGNTELNDGDKFQFIREK